PPICLKQSSDELSHLLQRTSSAEQSRFFSLSLAALVISLTSPFRENQRLNPSVGGSPCPSVMAYTRVSSKTCSLLVCHPFENPDADPQVLSEHLTPDLEPYFIWYSAQSDVSVRRPRIYLHVCVSPEGAAASCSSAF
uniref:Uncharacterized protein n=1 Tax=Oryzias latipes TaxID=8090 RepID=A0A3B3HB15_ORYLA